MSMHVEKPALWSVEDAAAATRGKASGPSWTATGVSIDSRTIAHGDLFVALKGPSFDGHAYVAQALAAGAAAAVVSERPAGLGKTMPLLMVADTFTALQDLGREGRRRTVAKVVAITGSVGKTGTKEALAKCLAAQGLAYATVGSLNNHWGVPLSLSRLPADSRFGVFELGMNHAGEIGPLSHQVKPDVGVITTIEPAHMEFFASLEAIADAKAELFEGMASDSTIILNRDNAQFGRLAAAAHKRGLWSLWSFGADAHADARLLDCSVQATSSMVTAQIFGERVQYCVAQPGRHWVTNSLAVLLAVRALGGDLQAAAVTLGHLMPVKGRGTRQRVQAAKGVFTLIDESYNASPASMAAAFQVLAATQPGAGGRRVAVLGDMRELGERSDAFHAGLAEPLVAAGIDLVYCSGPHMNALYRELPPALQGGHAADSAALAPVVTGAVAGGDVILVKGSAGSRMGAVVAALSGLDRSVAQCGEGKRHAL
ncbi:MAG: UDP-N-acetylmuramoylalanyl-D-glutamyl-2,6-diaminopimelate--D-alanyl-D-alanine ligase [Rhodospirillaceae bacterium]